MGEYNRFIWPTPLEMQYSHFCKAGWLCLNVFWGFIARYCPTEYSCKNTPMWAQLLVAVYKNWVFFNRLMKWVRSMTYTLHSRGWLWQPSLLCSCGWAYLIVLGGCSTLTGLHWIARILTVLWYREYDSRSLGMWWGIVRCFGPWAKQFKINPKDPLIHACIYGKVGDFSPTLLLQVE